MAGYREAIENVINALFRKETAETLIEEPLESYYAHTESELESPYMSVFRVDYYDEATGGTGSLYAGLYSDEELAEDEAFERIEELYGATAGVDVLNIARQYGLTTEEESWSSYVD